jgi:hypothetical protein
VAEDLPDRLVFVFVGLHLGVDRADVQEAPRRQHVHEFLHLPLLEVQKPVFLDFFEDLLVN